MNDYFYFESGSQPAALAEVLKRWRTSHNYSLYTIAKYENRRIETFQHIEEGSGNVATLLCYFDFIANHDRQYLNEILTDWRKECGYE